MGLARPYNYDHQMSALRTRLRGCGGKSWNPPSREAAQRLVIPLSNFLAANEIKAKYRNDVRYKIMSVILGREINSTYDLTACECTTISDFLFNSGGEGLTPEAYHFLIDLTVRSENECVPTKEQVMAGRVRV